MHGLVEIDWDFLAVGAPAFVAAGSLLPPPRAEKRRASLPAALALAGVGVAVLASLFLPWLADRWTNDARAVVDRPARAVALARRARQANPLALEPVLVQALAEEVRGRDAAALALLRKATELQPQNPTPWAELGTFWLDSGCPREALPALERYVELDPQPRDQSGYAAKDRALAQVNSGKYGSCVSERRR